MLNSFTNFLHALALGTYATLVYVGMQSGNVFYTPAIFILFFLLLVLKLCGVLVHLPKIEKNIKVRNALWVAIGVGVTVLNFATLYALQVPAFVLFIGVGTTLGLTGWFFFMLCKEVRYLPLASALIFVYLLAAVWTCGLLRIGFVLVVLSNILWILLARVLYLKKHAYHNDLYHLALIVSTYVLYHSVTLGLWQGGVCSASAGF